MSGAGGMTDAELAAALAEAAGRIALEVRANKLLGLRALSDAGDKTANAFLVRALQELRPDDGLLSEESADDASRLDKSRVWVIDPLDGSREYGEERTDWAVHVGLAIDGVAAAGAVALPGLDEVLRTDRPILVSPPPQRLRMVVSRTRPAKEATAVAEQIGAELIPMGSAGAKTMAVIRGEADIYLHTGGQFEWDSCAPAAVAVAHGLHASRIGDRPLTYNQRDSYLPDLLICRKEHAPQILDFIREGPF
jgi:3'(2'), 5'-bisphosphate nucleotidase